jgi:hypothetical protein
MGDVNDDKDIIIESHFSPRTTQKKFSSFFIKPDFFSKHKEILGKYHKNWFFIAIRIISVLIVICLLIYYVATNDHELLFKNNATIFISLLIVLDIVLDHLSDKD